MKNVEIVDCVERVILSAEKKKLFKKKQSIRLWAKKDLSLNYIVQISSDHLSTVK